MTKKSHFELFRKMLKTKSPVNKGFFEIGPARNVLKMWHDSCYIKDKMKHRDTARRSRNQKPDFGVRISGKDERQRFNTETQRKRREKERKRENVECRTSNIECRTEKIFRLFATLAPLAAFAIIFSF